MIADVQDDKGTRLADELGKSSAYFHADVSRESDVSGAIAHALSCFGGLDCLYNNAGLGGVSGPIAEIPVDGYDQTVGVPSGGLPRQKHAHDHEGAGSGSIVSTRAWRAAGGRRAPHLQRAKAPSSPDPVGGHGWARRSAGDCMPRRHATRSLAGLGVSGAERTGSPRR